MPQQVPLTDRLMVTIEEAGQLIGVSRAQAYRLADAGVIPIRRLGERCTRVPMDKFRQWMNDGCPGIDQEQAAATQKAQIRRVK